MNLAESPAVSQGTRQHKLSTLLWIDEQYHDQTGENTLKECLGDSYLYANNVLYAAARQLFLSLGFQYSRTHDICRYYNAGPLMSLHDILASGTVPYHDNISVLRQALLRCPDLLVSSRDLQMQLKTNYLLHESCHCIADRIFEQGENNGHLQCSPKEKFVLKALICESFAQTVERVASALADCYPHVLFFHLNSPVECQPLKARTILDAISIFGMENLMRFGFLSILFSNTHSVGPQDSVFAGFVHSVFNHRQCSTAENVLLRLLCENVLTVNQGFREATSSLYFRMFSCEQEYRQCENLDFLPATLDRLAILENMVNLTRAVSAVSENIAADRSRRSEGVGSATAA